MDSSPAAVSRSVIFCTYPSSAAAMYRPICRAARLREQRTISAVRPVRRRNFFISFSFRDTRHG